MAAPSVHLVPLVCVKCRQPIVAQPDEVAWVCQTCQTCNLLGQDGLVREQEIAYSSQLTSGGRGRPFWVAQGKVTISDRQTYKGNEGKESAAFWSEPRLFFIPAYQAGLADLVAQGMTLLRQPPQEPAPGGAAPFLPVVTSPQDIVPLAEFIVLAIEADRRDALKSVNFNVQLESPRLWVLP